MILFFLNVFFNLFYFCGERNLNGWRPLLFFKRETRLAGVMKSESFMRNRSSSRFGDEYRM